MCISKSTIICDEHKMTSFITNGMCTFHLSTALQYQLGRKPASYRLSIMRLIKMSPSPTDHQGDGLWACLRNTGLKAHRLTTNEAISFKQCGQRFQATEGDIRKTEYFQSVSIIIPLGCLQFLPNNCTLSFPLLLHRAQNV